MTLFRWENLFCVNFIQLTDYHVEHPHALCVYKMELGFGTVSYVTP